MNAEQVRRAGDAQRAVDLCRDALVRFPGHLSARVTLGWALLDLGKLKEAREEFESVRKSAPDNFAAIRGLAQLHVLEESHPEAYSFEDVDGEPASEADRDDHRAPILATLEGWLSRVQTLKEAV